MCFLIHCNQSAYLLPLHRFFMFYVLCFMLYAACFRLCVCNIIHAVLHANQAMMNTMRKQLQPKRIHYYKHDKEVPQDGCTIVYTPLYINTQVRKHLRKDWQAQLQSSGMHTRDLRVQLKFQANGGELHVGVLSSGAEGVSQNAMLTSLANLAYIERRRAARECTGDLFVCPWKTSRFLGVLLRTSVHTRTRLQQGQTDAVGFHSSKLAELQFASVQLQHTSVACLLQSVTQHTFARLHSVYTHLIPSILSNVYVNAGSR